MRRQFKITKCDKLIAALPATRIQLVSLLDSTPRRLNGLLCYLQKKGLIRLDHKWQSHSNRRGRKPYVWVKVK